MDVGLGKVRESEESGPTIITGLYKREARRSKEEGDNVMMEAGTRVMHFDDGGRGHGPLWLLTH